MRGALADDLAWAIERLEVADVDSPRVDAELLAEHAFSISRFMVPIVTEAELGEDAALNRSRYRALVARRATREPLQYILGVAWFGHLELQVGPGVFIPRPETELLAEWADRQLAGRETAVVVDLCSGSGALAAYLADRHPNVKVAAVERNSEALHYLNLNTAAYPHVSVIQADVTAPDLRTRLRAAGLGPADLVVCNPPYVPAGAPVSAEVRHDPAEAVFSGDDGLDLLRALVPRLPGLLRDGGLVGIEHDDAHQVALRELLRTAESGGLELAKIRLGADLTGRDRFIYAQATESGHYPIGRTVGPI